MIILDATTHKLQIFLGGAVATTQPSWEVSYSEFTATAAGLVSGVLPASLTGLTNGATEVDILAAPASGKQRIAKSISIFNRDSAAITVTVVKDISATNYTIHKATLAAGEKLEYTDDAGWNVYNSVGVPIVASGGAGGGAAIGISAGTQSVSTGTIVFSNSNGVTFGMSGSSQITASVASSLTNINASAGTTSNNLSAIVFSNSNGISFGLNGSTVTGTVATNYQSQGAYLTTAMLSNAATISNIRVSAGTTSNLLSAMTFSNLNGVTFGLDGSTITASVAAAGGAQTGISGLSAGTTQMTSGTAVFSNSNGISFGVDGNTVTAQHNALTTAMASNRGSDFVQATAAFAGTNASGTIASNGISVSVGNYITTGALSNHSHGVSFTSGSVGFQTLSFTNSNGISFNSGTQGIFGSHNAITTGRASTDAVGLNTAQTNVTWTVNSSGLSLNAGGYAGTNTATTGAISVTLNTSGISLNIGAYITTAAISNHSHGVSFTSGSVAFQTLSFTNSNGISFNSGTQGIFGSHNGLTTQTNQQMTLFATGNTTLSSTGTTNASSFIFRGSGVASVGITNGSVLIDVPAGGGGLTNVNISAGTTSQNLSNLVFSNSNGVSFGLNGSTITGSVNAAGGGLTVSHYEPMPIISSRALGQGTFYMQRHVIPYAINAEVIGVAMHISNSSNAGGSISAYFGIYTLNGATWSIASSSSGGFSYNSTLATSYTNISGTRMQTHAIGTWNITPGEYMFGIGWSVGTALTSGSYTYMCNRSALSGVGSMFGVGNVTYPSMYGVYSAATNAVPAAISISQIIQTGSAYAAQPYFVLADST